MKEAGGDVIGVDWRIDLADACGLLGPDVGVQGNLDPITLFAPPDVIEEQGRGGSGRRRAAETGTSSIWVTESCPRRPRRTWRSW